MWTKRNLYWAALATGLLFSSGLGGLGGLGGCGPIGLVGAGLAAILLLGRGTTTTTT